MVQTFCPQCKVAPVVKIKRFGAPPRCAKCLEKNKRGRYARRNQKCKEGKTLSHYNADGIRYATAARDITVFCTYCKQSFTRSSRLRGAAVCETCQPKAAEDRRVKKLRNVTDNYWKDPERIRKQRLANTLKRMGLTLEWYDAQIKECGICRVTKPGGRGYWHMDHDHQCCPYGVRQGCAKCVRGLLCHSCNVGLGHFKDNISLLLAAVVWLKKGRTQRRNLTNE